MTSQQQSTDDGPAAARERRSSPDMHILAIDIGGSGLKAAVLDWNGDMVSERLRVKTPSPLKPETLVDALAQLVEPLPEYSCISVGFPGIVRNGKIITAPNLGTKNLKSFDLAAALEQRLGKLVRVLNDADMQGLAAIEGKGVEMVITLGTGFGSALYMDGQLAPHLELAHLPFRKGETYEEQLGNKALKRIGKKKWSRRVQMAIESLRKLTNFDKFYIGGGNADKIELELEPDVTIVSNECGVRGGAWLWRPKEGAQ